jgi:hypothetical protein
LNSNSPCNIRLRNSWPHRTGTVTFNEKTALQGYSSAELIKKNQPVEVTYRSEENANLALTIKQLPEGACQ